MIYYWLWSYVYVCMSSDIGFTAAPLKLTNSMVQTYLVRQSLKLSNPYKINLCKLITSL